jgi:catechol 2,3-dioxygenase-like lactoylglutathione lyase family enzyme
MTPEHERAPALQGDGMELTHLLVVADVERSTRFYVEALGAEVHREYGGTSAVLRFLGTWLLLVTGGGPTADKPGVDFAAPPDPGTASHEMIIAVPDCRAAYEALRTYGVEFLAAPTEYEWEVRCFLRDPDGHLIELSESKRHVTER